jgi:hypothetical protein
VNGSKIKNNEISIDDVDILKHTMVDEVWTKINNLEINHHEIYRYIQQNDIWNQSIDVITSNFLLL